MGGCRNSALAEMATALRPIAREWISAKISILAMNTDIAKTSLALAINRYLREGVFGDDEERERAHTLLERFQRNFGHGRGKETLLDLLRIPKRSLRNTPGTGNATLHYITDMLTHFGLEKFRPK